MKKIKKEYGITLVALVITIIILLILAGVAIVVLTQTELFDSANRAKEKTIYVRAKEIIEINLMEIRTKYQESEYTISNIYNEFVKSENITIYDFYTEEVSKIESGIENDATKIINLNKIVIFVDGAEEYKFVIGKEKNINGIIYKNEIISIEEYEKNILGIKSNKKEENEEIIKDGFIPQIEMIGNNNIKISIGKGKIDLKGNIEKYEYHIGKEKIETNEKECNIENIENNVKYPIYIIVYDDLGNYIKSDTINAEICKYYNDLTNKVAENSKKIIASNNQSSAYKVFDKDNKTYWDGGDINAFIIYEFDIPEEITYVEISQPYTVDVIKNFKIQYSDDNINYYDATNELTFLNNNEKQKFNLKSNLGKHKYWKYQNLTGYRKTNYCGITELSFGKTKIEFNKEKDLTQIANKEDVKNGKIFASNNEESAYLVFDKNNTTYWDGGNVDAFIGYKFDFPVEVSKVSIIQPYTKDVINQFKIQYSDDGKNYYDAAETFIFVKNREMQSFKLQSNLRKHKYWRYKNLTGYRQSDYCGISEIKFYKEF